MGMRTRFRRLSVSRMISPDWKCATHPPLKPVHAVSLPHTKHPISSRFRSGFLLHLTERRPPKLAFNRSAVIGINLAGRHSNVPLGILPLLVGQSIKMPNHLFRRRDSILLMEFRR